MILSSKAFSVRHSRVLLAGIQAVILRWPPANSIGGDENGYGRRGVWFLVPTPERGNENS